METIIRYIKIARLICKQRLFGLEQSEERELNEWKGEYLPNDSMYRELPLDKLDERYNRADIDREWGLFQKRLGKHRNHKLVLLLSVAAGICLLVGVIYIFSLRASLNERPSPASFEAKNGIRLILSNGEQFSLSGGENIPEEKMEGKAKLTANSLEYKRDEKIAGKEEQNTLVIPAGAFYHLILSDGTRVWLNAETRITYPVAFSGKTREVILSGEAYFQVAEDKATPFIVKTDHFDVRVLGTSFNINTYGDDGKAYTALEEGVVEISKGSSDIRLMSPGQVMELDIQNPGSSFCLSDIRAEQQLAWKEGEFCFRKTSLPEILKQIERYYDVHFINISGSLQEYYTGTISRNVSLEVLLSVIEQSTEVRFRITGKTVCIEKKRD